MRICIKKFQLTKRIFISKNESEVQELAKNLAEENKSLIAHSFLSFEQEEFTIEKNYEVLFFSSPRAVVFFKTRYEIPKNKLIACTGNTTRVLLASFGVKVDFWSNNPGKIKQLATDFKDWCGKKNVLFPLSNISKKTVSSLFDEDQKEELVVYKTVIKGKKIEPCDKYVFTSPSNVRGFFMENNLSKDVKVISWGESTSEELRKVGVSNYEEMVEASLDKIFLDEA